MTRIGMSPKQIRMAGKFIEVTWCKRDFTTYTQVFQNVRSRLADKMNECYLCKKLFCLGDHLGLCHVKGAGNKVLCSLCAQVVIGATSASPPVGMFSGDDGKESPDVEPTDGDGIHRHNWEFATSDPGWSVEKRCHVCQVTLHCKGCNLIVMFQELVSERSLIDDPEQSKRRNEELVGLTQMLASMPWMQERST